MLRKICIIEYINKYTQKYNATRTFQTPFYKQLHHESYFRYYLL
jgi:hypothetical protein